MISAHPSYTYATEVITGAVDAPKYVHLQCAEFIRIADGEDERYMIDEARLSKVDKLCKLIILSKGLKAGTSAYDSLAGFQWLLIVASLCTVFRDQPEKRRYESVLLEIARKNGKTFLIAIMFLLLFFLEPRFSKFYSVAPDGSLSREVQTQLKELIASSPALCGEYKGRLKFKTLRDEIKCQVTDSSFIPLNYSNSRLDGKLPSVFLVDETGALPNRYAIDAMRSGQLTVLNKLGFVISTKYPTFQNPFEDEVAYAKKVLDGETEDERLFALLYEPDDPTDWANNDHILAQANPLALVVPEIMEDLLNKRKQAIDVPSARENFCCKHCNIIFSGSGTETFVSVDDLKACRSDEPIDWTGRDVFVGLDLSMTNDNTAVGMVAWDEETETLLMRTQCFIPEGKIEEKNRVERLNYRSFIDAGHCTACGDRTIDYAVVESWVMDIERKFGCHVVRVGYDRWNCLSTAQKLEARGMEAVEIRQHSSVLHPPTKWLSELIEEHRCRYERDELLEINFANARCLYDTNLNRYVTKKRSAGKIDLVVSLINATYLAQQDVQLAPVMDWTFQC